MHKLRMLMVVLLSSFSLVGYGDNASTQSPADFVKAYETVLRQQDNGLLASMLADDVTVQVTLLMADEEPMLISLTRDEFLQQQRALWLFASVHEFHFDKPVVRKVADEGGRTRWQVTVEQQERYELFRSSLNRENRIALVLEQRDDALLIKEIHTQSREW